MENDKKIITNEDVLNYVLGNKILRSFIMIAFGAFVCISEIIFGSVLIMNIINKNIFFTTAALSGMVLFAFAFFMSFIALKKNKEKEQKFIDNKLYFIKEGIVTNKEKFRKKKVEYRRTTYELKHLIQVDGYDKPVEVNPVEYSQVEPGDDVYLIFYNDIIIKMLPAKLYELTNEVRCKIKP